MSRLIIIDDHPVVRLALSSFFEAEGFKVVGEADNGSGAIKLARAVRCDAVILDLSIPKSNGLDVMERILKLPAPPKIIVFTAISSDEIVLRAIQGGAAGFVQKKRGVIELGEVVKGVLSGHKVFPCLGLECEGSSAITEDKALISKLSNKELMILYSLAEGMSANDIARGMCLSRSAIYGYRFNLMKKLKLESIIDLGNFAKNNNIFN